MRGDYAVIRPVLVVDILRYRAQRQHQRQAGADGDQNGTGGLPGAFLIKALQGEMDGIARCQNADRHDVVDVTSFHNRRNHSRHKHRGQDRQQQKKQRHKLASLPGQAPLLPESGSGRTYERQKAGEHGCPQTLADLAEIITESARPGGQVFQVAECVSARNQLVRSQVPDGGRKAQQHQAHTQKGTEGETKGDFPLLPPKTVQHREGTEEEGVKHEIILGHQPQADAQADGDLIFQRGLSQLPDAEQGQQNREEGHQHIHADHQHRAETDTAEPVEEDTERRRCVIGKELAYEHKKQHERPEIDHQVGNQPDPLAELILGQGRAEIDDPVVQGRVDIQLLIRVDRGKVKAVLSGDGEIVKKVFPRQKLLLHPFALSVTDEGLVMAVRETVGIDLVDEHAAFPQAEVKTDPQHQQKAEGKQKKSAVLSFSHSALPPAPAPVPAGCDCCG